MDKSSGNISNKSKHSLQKFTFFESLETREQYLDLKANNPELLDEYYKYLIKKINEGITSESPEEGIVDKYYKRLELCTDTLSPDKGPELRRTRWQVNKTRIENVIHNYIVTKNRLPAHCEIEDRTGLSRQTISKHIKEGVTSNLYQEELNSFRLMTMNLLGCLYKLGIERKDVRAIKVYLDYFKESSGGVLPSIKEQNNYIQINNTLIDEITVNELPEGARLQIENIIKQYQNK
jgi:DNA-binding transcriptional ArsR family regulator